MLADIAIGVNICVDVFQLELGLWGTFAGSRVMTSFTEAMLVAVSLIRLQSPSPLNFWILAFADRHACSRLSLFYR